MERAPAHLAATGSPYICRSFSRRMAQAMRNARSSPYFLIETLVRPFFSRPAFRASLSENEREMRLA